MTKEFRSRVITAIFYVGLIFLCTTTKPIAFILMIAFFAGVCYYEIQKFTQIQSIFFKFLGLAGIGLIFYIYLDFYNPFVFSFRTLMPIILFVISVLVIFRHPEELVTDQGKLIVSVAYIGIPFGLALSLPKYNLEQPHLLVLYFFIIIWASDSFAFFVGKAIGKKPLAKNISSNKTVEGLIGGFFGSILVSFLIGIIDKEMNQSLIIPGILIGVFAPMGDLTQSKLKRVFGVKDSGHLLPGHGGFLDRLDSFIFVVPVLYLYYIIEHAYS